MPFADHIGPDASRRKNAWGAGSGVGKRATKKNATRTHPNPKIVTTTQRAHNYRSAYCPNMTPMAGASRERSEDLPPLRSPNVTRKPKTVRLASSMARPKARPVVPPPRAGAWKKNAKTVHVSTPFRNFYDRGDIPVCIAHSGTLDLLDQGGEKVLAVVPQLVMPIKKALNTKNRKTISRVLQVLQHLARCAPFIGEALVPYYRQILPVFNLVLLLDPRDNLGDQIDYGQQKRENLVDLILETLEVLEETGGRDAYINIKYQIPSYESSVHA
ncbi:Parkin coregulated protein-like [Hondaea fermentalgiana]|uniref:Parkin coregulated protein-like n=1 Tax=Hondaea fermentalgiana TaxID=2315210 RepID=A0A2R5GK96_9STRA|nr:Parkin coregulated protein-like [Hondaea fermentalgiana]|eukprot:GBG31300.1 Parkin coregulated protein-like [Hondaea fermentalgiana]